MKTIVAQVYVEKDKKILMVQENKESVKGKWNMPAGKLEDNETIVEAAIREVKEETNLDIVIKGLISIQQNISEIGQLIIFYFLGEYISGDISFDKKEIADVKWLSKKEILNMNKNKIRGGETIEDILKFAEAEIIPLDRIKIENF